MVAITVDPLLHTPPLVVTVSPAELLVHICVIPVIAEGFGFTVTAFVFMQPPGIV